jgi:hypothetical protein
LAASVVRLLVALVGLLPLVLVELLLLRLESLAVAQLAFGALLRTCLLASRRPQTLQQWMPLGQLALQGLVPTSPSAMSHVRA